MFTWFFLAFGIGALIAVVFVLPTLTKAIVQGLVRIVVDLPKAAIAGIRQGVADSDRITARLQGKVSETEPGARPPR